jgi:hypothetical protein
MDKRELARLIWTGLLMAGYVGLATAAHFKWMCQ